MFMRKRPRQRMRRHPTLGRSLECDVSGFIERVLGLGLRGQGWQARFLGPSHVIRVFDLRDLFTAQFLENDLLDLKSFSLNLKQKTGIRILVIVLPILQAVNSVMTDKEVIPQPPAGRQLETVGGPFEFGCVRWVDGMV